jgi:hypothetical protein
MRMIQKITLGLSALMLFGTIKAQESPSLESS